MERLKALLNGRCPHCLQGKVYRSFWHMNTHCGVCGIKFEREDGYFMMAVFLGYIISFLIAAVILLGLYLWVKPTILGYTWATAVPLVLLAPWIYRSGRLIWLHLDEMLDPRLSDADKAGLLDPPSGIDLMLTHEDETADHFYTRKKTPPTTTPD